MTILTTVSNIPPPPHAVPHLLSCMIPLEDSAAQILPDSSWNSTESDCQLLINHNEAMTQVVREFSQFVGEFRLNVKTTSIKQEKEEISRKRNFEKIS